MRNTSLLLFAVLLSSSWSGAQITVPSTTLPALGDKLRYSWAYDQATFDMVTPPGFDLVWDFSNLTVDENLDVEYLDPSQGVYVYRFPGANLMTRNAAGEERYYQVSASGLKLLGWTESKLFGEPFPVVYDLTRNGRIPNGGFNERFTPLNFFDVYSQSANILEGFRFYDLPPPLVNAYLAAGLTTTDSIRLRYAYTHFTSVDAYGTLTIPGQNAQYQVLRMKNTHYREGRVDAHVIPLGWLDITDLTMQYFPASIASVGIDTSGALRFMNDIVKEEIALITLDSEGRPHHVRFKNEAPPSCFDPDLVNATLNGDPIAPGDYAASQTITSAGRVAGGSTVNFTAGIQISLQAGFQAEPGSSFTARVIACPVNAVSPTIAQSSDVLPAAPPQQIPRLLNAEGRLSVYPNPITTSTRIEYSLSRPGPVSLVVMEANGRRLETLETTQWQTEGAHVMEWTPTINNSGLLYLVLRTEEGVCTRKMALIR
jgi:hypothetical protein